MKLVATALENLNDSSSNKGSKNLFFVNVENFESQNPNQFNSKRALNNNRETNVLMVFLCQKKRNCIGFFYSMKYGDYCEKCLVSQL